MRSPAASAIPDQRKPRDGGVTRPKGRLRKILGCDDGVADASDRDRAHVDCDMKSRCSSRRPISLRGGLEAELQRFVSPPSACRTVGAEPLRIFFPRGP